MAIAQMSRIYFAVTFPPPQTHVSTERLALLARKQLQDIEIIETIDHLFKCNRCFNNYRVLYRHMAGHQAQTARSVQEIESASDSTGFSG
jgi:hypothetical protein